MSKYTPTTEQVEDGFAHEPEYEYHNPIGYGLHVQANRRAFKRWLAEVERAAAEKALVAAADAVGDPRFKDDQNTATLGDLKRWLRECAASYRRNEGESE